jgi:hypothetical protein
VLGEDGLKSSNNPPGVGPGTAAASGNEDHAEMTAAAGHDCLMVQRAVVAQVVGHDRAALGPGQHQDTLSNNAARRGRYGQLLLAE